MTKFIQIRENDNTYLINIDDISYIQDRVTMVRVNMKSKYNNGNNLYFDLDENFDNFCFRLKQITD